MQTQTMLNRDTVEAVVSSVRQKVSSHKLGLRLELDGDSLSVFGQSLLAKYSITSHGLVLQDSVPSVGYKVVPNAGVLLDSLRKLARTGARL